MMCRKGLPACSSNIIIVVGMASSTGSSSAARRRRIAERGSDRLALITGRINSLPDQHPSPLVHLSEREDRKSSSFPTKHESITEAVQLNSNYDNGTSVEPYTHKSEIISDDSSPSSVVDGKVQSATVSSTTVHAPLDSTSNVVDHHSKIQALRNIFTPSQISSAVAASEITRICCSLAVAIVVFLCYIEAPILGSYLAKNVILCRPLYLLLVTNVTIVLAHLLLEKPKGVVSSGKEASGASLLAAFGSGNQLGKALELGLVLQHVVGALFMDCIVYSIVVICFLSLAQKLVW